MLIKLVMLLSVVMMLIGFVAVLRNDFHLGFLSYFFGLVYFVVFSIVLNQS